MKVLLIHRSNPGRLDAQNRIVPNGLYYLGAVLEKNNHKVTLRNYSENTDEEIIKEISELQPDFVGISCFTFNAYTILQLCKLVKKVNPNIKTVLGGPHATELGKEILKRVPEADLIVNFEGEMSFLDIVNKLDLPSINGITYRAGKEIITTNTRLPINIDDLPNPSNYFKYQRLITSRGCPGMCTFCSTPQFWGQRLRNKSPKRVVDELEELHNKYGISYFIFSDDTFTASRDRTIEVCKLIIDRKLKISWDCRSRVNFMSEDRVRWLRDAGCISLSFGVESGSPRILKNIRKHINLEQVQRSSEWTKKYGLQLNFFIIVGSPGENDESIQETIDVLRKTRPHSILVSIMQLTPDTEICKNVPVDYWFKDYEGPKYYTDEHPIEKLNEFVKTVYTEFEKCKGSYTFEELASMVKHDPSSVAFGNLGLFYLSKNMLNDAYICFNKGLEINPGHAQLYNNRGVSLIRANKPEQAALDFEKASKLNPEDTLALSNLSRIYESLQKEEEARQCLTRVLTIDPNNEKAKIRLAELACT